MKKPLLMINFQLTGLSKVIFRVNLIDQFSGLVIGSETRVRSDIGQFNQSNCRRCRTRFT